MTITMTIGPTDEFFMHAGIAVRAWRGTLYPDGTEVVALVAAVSGNIGVPGGVVGLTPIPPPAKSWSPQVQYLMQRVWQLGDRLSAKEANALAVLAEGWVEDRERKKRRAAVRAGAV